MCVLSGEKRALILACAYFGVYFFSRIQSCYFLFFVRLLTVFSTIDLKYDITKQLKEISEHFVSKKAFANDF